MQHIKHGDSIKAIQHKVHLNAKEHGWWEGRSEKDIPTMLCLIHSEVSEALEGYRNNDTANFAEELADIVIRVLDMAEGFGIDLEEELIKKHAFNMERPFRHGNKRC